jgi:hypothetical protein
MERSLDETIRRTQAYWYVDGLAEIGFGGALLLGAAYYAAATVAPEQIAGALLMGQPSLVVAGYVLARHVVRELKERLTYPRTGYVAYKALQHSHRTWAYATTLLLAFGVARTVVTLNGRMDVRFWPLIAGMSVAVVMLVLGLHLAIGRFFVLAVGSVAIGTLVSLSQLGWPANAAVGLFFAGLGAIASGSVTLRNYLLATEPGDAEAHTGGGA